MNERIWEGIIQVLRQNEAPLTATARLWRRDDFFGTDWGGQLELPIALRRALPPGEYTIVLAPGREAVAFIGLGPSNAASTFPTVTGTSAPPFGAAPAAPANDAEDDDEDGTPTAELALEAEAESEDDVAEVEQTEGVEDTPASRPRPAARATSRKRPARAAAAKAAAPARPADTLKSDVTKPVEPAPVEPSRAATPPAEAPQPELNEEPTVPETAPTPPPATPVTPIPFTPPAVSWNGNSAEGIARTERLARAFLAAIDTRQRMQSVNATGVEGHFFSSARALVDELAALVESRLRGSNDSVQWLGQRLAVLEWFGATIASMPDRPDLVELGQSLTRLSAVVQTTINEPQAVAA